MFFTEYEKVVIKEKLNVSHGYDYLVGLLKEKL